MPEKKAPAIVRDIVAEEVCSLCSCDNNLDTYKNDIDNHWDDEDFKATILRLLVDFVREASHNANNE